MSLSLSRTTYVQVVFLVLLVVCVVQVTWWMYDQWAYTAAVQARIEALYERELRAAETALLEGVPAEAVRALFPSVVLDDDGPRVNPQAQAVLESERRHRLNMYGWEGGFFLLVLVSGIWVLWRTVDREVQLRLRQQNFLAAVTHEFKSPLAAVRLTAQTLELRDPDQEERQRLVRRLLHNLDRVDRTVANVLETARIEEGALTHHAIEVDLARAVDPILGELATRARLEGIDFLTDLPAGLAIEADPDAIDTILRNLVDNAFRAVIDCEAPRVEVVGTAIDSEVHLVVSDNGRGFASREADRLFRKFYRPGDELRRERQGTGLGLYIVRHLVERSRGAITATSRGQSCGATFTVTWPASGKADT